MFGRLTGMKLKVWNNSTSDYAVLYGVYYISEFLCNIPNIGPNAKFCTSHLYFHFVNHNIPISCVGDIFF